MESNGIVKENIKKSKASDINLHLYKYGFLENPSNTYSNIDGKTPLNVLNIIENIYTGSNSKGNVDTKIDKVSEMYEMMSLTQYETLIEKLKK